MMRNILILMVLVLAGFLAFKATNVYAGTKAPQSTPELRKAFSSSKKTVVFFMNPSGTPCGMQNEILQKLLKDRGNNFNLVYVNATKQADQKAFYDYGIRSMPSIVLVDAKGNIGKVFPPGIQSYETVSQALDSIK